MILIVDDQQEILNVVREAIEKAGYVVDPESDGARAVAKASVNVYKIILMDLGVLGRMRGVDAAIAIRALPYPHGDVPIIAITGGLTNEDPEAMKKAQFEVILFKPFRLKELLDSIKSFTSTQ